MRKGISLLLLLSISWNTCSYGEDPEQKGFFEKDYVTGDKPVSAETAEPTPEKAANSVAPDIGLPAEGVKQPKNEGAFIELGDDPAVKHDASDRSSRRKDRDKIIPRAIDTGDKIKSIELLVSTADEQRLGPCLGHFIQLLRSRDLESHGVTIVLKDAEAAPYLQAVLSQLSAGLMTEDEMKIASMSEDDASKFSPAEAEQALQAVTNSPMLAKRIQTNMLTHVTWSIPDQYPIKQLPTWILHTDKGAVVLEGIEDPSEMITQNGKFVEPFGKKVS